MGRKVSDGKAFNGTPPDAAVINDYDLYRVGGENGVAIGHKDANESKTLAFEKDTNAIYSVKIPTGLDPDPGDYLWWDDPSTFQDGATDLVDAPNAEGDSPCFLVTESKNDADYVRGRVLNGSGGGGAEAAGESDVTPQASTGLTLTDSTGDTGTNDTTIANVPLPTDTPASADALRDDLATNVIPVIEQNLSDLAAVHNALVAKLVTAGVLT